MTKKFQTIEQKNILTLSIVLNNKGEFEARMDGGVKFTCRQAMEFMLACYDIIEMETRIEDDYKDAWLLNDIHDYIVKTRDYIKQKKL